MSEDIAGRVVGALRKIADKSRHKGKRRWITVLGLAIAVVGWILFLMTFRGGSIAEALPRLLPSITMAVGGLMVMVNELTAVPQRDPEDHTGSEHKRKP